ncbi:MAG: ABC transporter substrate-binding protein [Akkermansiaceae bacterium]|jgi:microcin C transport system substrate-binding protein|nr:ABC transporter substrate-binding protein [Akkermansiaceae bacterium]
MKSLLRMIRFPAPAAAALALAGCGDDTGRPADGHRFAEFVPAYNSHIRAWVAEQRAATLAEQEKVEAELAGPADDHARETLELRQTALQRELAKWDFRLSLDGYFSSGTPDEIPAELKWVDGMDEPEIGDPAAVKGGTLRQYITTFPATITPFGPNSNHGFRGELYDNISLPLVAPHPLTQRPIPGLAKQWALDPDGRTVWFRLNPLATYSNGEPVKAWHFQFAIYLRVSDDIFAPFSKQWFREQFARVATYGDDTLAVTLPEPKLFIETYAGALVAECPSFYDAYGADYAERYQWRFPPTTGAYEVRDNGIVKGVSVTQERVRDWWARDLKYYRHRFNPDRIVYLVIRNEPKAFELFRAGELDTFFLTRPNMWYEKSQIREVFDGHIERTTFYNRWPHIPRGFYLNVTKPPLDNRDVRVGIQHATNWRKVIDVIQRGDYQRLNSFGEGYPVFSDPSIRARPYSVSAARAAFARAGYTDEGKDGILRKPDGTRLSVTVTYPVIPYFDQMFSILREQARACGLDLRLNGLEVTVAYRNNMQKQHQIAFSAWTAGPPVPDYYQFLHSSTAFDERGNPKPHTNNLFVWAHPETDRLCEAARFGRTAEEVRDACWRLQRIMHDEAIFVPAYTVDFVRLANWRWIRWPDSEHTRFSPPVTLDPHTLHVLWIDQAMMAETLAARRTGQRFPEVTRMADAYRQVATQPLETQDLDDPSDPPDPEAASAPIPRDPPAADDP